jgi:hypothetical protein
MTTTQKRYFILLLLLAAAGFGLFILPNRVASDNLSMVQMFQPDEAAPMPYLLKMIAPADGLNHALRQFVFYEYYYYGFPYFALSALVLLPLQWAGRLAEVPLVMLVLRQLISVLPMLAGLLLLVYMQDGFRTYRSPVLFVFLLSVTAVVQNNLWWHPDGITFLLVALTLYFLKRDELRFGGNFLAAAAAVGIATATKLVGVYFFLAVGLTLLLGILLKKASWQRLIGMSAAFLAVMAISYLAANPFLLSHWARAEYFNIFHQQTGFLSDGYGVVYAKGPAAAWPLMHASYGELIFLAVALAAAVWGAWRGPDRLLHGLILAWFLPLTVVVLWISHFKFQYWMPVALPLFSSLALLLPTAWPFGKVRLASLLTRIAGLLVLTVQFGFFLANDVRILQNDLVRAENNPRIQFYSSLLQALAPLPSGPVSVYYDYRLYVPPLAGWTEETNYDLLDYSYLQQKNFDVLLLLEQRIRDYTNPEVEGVDPAQFAQSLKFYRDAEQGAITGYHLVYRDATGLVLVREALYRQYFQK